MSKAIIEGPDIEYGKKANRLRWCLKRRTQYVVWGKNDEPTPLRYRRFLFRQFYYSIILLFFFGILSILFLERKLLVQLILIYLKNAVIVTTSSLQQSTMLTLRFHKIFMSSFINYRMCIFWSSVFYRLYQQ